MARRPTVVALIPARAGSKRVPDKNIRLLGGHPLIAYTIHAALESGVFDSVIVSTDSQEYADIATRYGARVPFLRPAAMAGEKSPDVEWVKDTLEKLSKSGERYDCFSILRPTSPFRNPATIQRAWKAFIEETGVDSLRAVEACKQHPGKMWVVKGNRMTPLLPQPAGEQPWHSSQFAALPVIHVQNASLEIAWSKVVHEKGSIAGDVVMPFFTEGLEGYDINQPKDFWYAERLVETKEVLLPQLKISSVKATRGV